MPRKADRLKLAKTLAGIVNARLGTSAVAEQSDLFPEEMGFELRHINTKFGKAFHLTVGVENRLTHVHIRFEDVSRAKAEMDCNPFSGKWNHYFRTPAMLGVDHSPTDTVAHFTQIIDRIATQESAA